MQAIHTTRYGAPDVLELREVPVPALADDALRIAVHASPVTAGDHRLRAADFPSPTTVIGLLMFGITKPRKPVQGTMFSGTVVAVGTGVTRFAVGDDVFGSVEVGAWAEQLVVKQDGNVALLPAGVSHAEAAAVVYGAGTALHFIEQQGQLQAGERIAILGAGGGVGRYAVQIAKHLGAHVTAVCSARDAELVRDLGADVVLDYRTDDIHALGETFDVVFDLAEASSFSRSRPMLTPNGRYITVYMTLTTLFWQAVTAIRGGPRALCGVALSTDLGRVSDLLTSGALRAVIGARFPFTQMAAAHRYTGAGDVVVDIVAPASLRAVG